MGGKLCIPVVSVLPLLLTSLSRVSVVDCRACSRCLPDMKYEGLLPSNLAETNRSSLIVKATIDPIRESRPSIVMILSVNEPVLQNQGFIKANSTAAVVGFYYFSDRDFLDFFSKKSRATPHQRHKFKKSNRTLTFLENNYLNQTRGMFQFNMEHSRKSDSRRESLGLQIYATYPGTQHCLSGRNYTQSTEKPNLHLDSCCYTRNICTYQSNQVYARGRTTPKSVDSFRRTLCECDEEFRSCLTSLNSPDSAYMGDLIYNVLELQCFHPTCNGATVKSYKECRGANLGFTWEPNVRPFPDVRLGHSDGS